MLRKLTLLAVAVAALIAIAGPAAAQAEGPLITNFVGEPAETITATGDDVTWTTPIGTLKCETVTLHIQLSHNSDTTATGSGTGTAIGNPTTANYNDTCVSTSGLTVKFEKVSVSDLHLTKHGGVTTGTITSGYTFDLYSHAFSTTTPVAHCSLHGTATATATGTSTLNIEGPLTKGPVTALCPENGELHGSFTLDDEFDHQAHID